MYVAEQIDDFLHHAASLSYLAFEQYVIAWKCLIDQDGPDPDRAHRNRKATWAQTGLTGRFDVEGPAIDHARLKTLMARFEQIEFHRGWTAAKQQWGDDATVDRLARTATQRRYDAFQELLRHVTLPTLTDPELQDDNDNTDTDGISEPAEPIETTLNIVIDADSAVHAHQGGVTAVHNGAVACGHHNRWRHTSKSKVVRLDDGTIATYRPNSTRIAPPT
jgi:hypothetical protein